MNNNDNKNEPLKSKRNMFTTAGKAIAFAWDTNRKLFLVLIMLYIFQGSVVFLQYTSFASIVDEIILIQQGNGSMRYLWQTAIILGLSFLVPMITNNILQHYR